MKESDKKLRKQVIDWFRYQNANTHPAKNDHARFVHCLSTLEEMAQQWLDDDKEYWPQILEMLNKISIEQFQELKSQYKKYEIT